MAQCNAQGDVEKLQRLEKEANAANQEVVLLSDELEKRDALVEQLQEDVQALKQQLESQRQASKQLEETVSARCDCRWMGLFALKFTLPSSCDGMLGMFLSVRRTGHCCKVAACGTGMLSWTSCAPAWRRLDPTQLTLLSWRQS